MNQLLEWLAGGDLRSDGLANEVAAFVSENPEAFADLFEGLIAPDDVVRGRSADALEKVARARPDLLVVRLPELLQTAEHEEVPMVLMHLAMAFGHLAAYEEQIEDLFAALSDLLDRQSAFVQSWAITGLCIVGRKYPDRRDTCVARILELQNSTSIAVRTRVRKAIAVLTQEGAPFPKGWIKSECLGDLEG